MQEIARDARQLLLARVQSRAISGDLPQSQAISRDLAQFGAISRLLARMPALLLVANAPPHAEPVVVGGEVDMADELRA